MSIPLPKLRELREAVKSLLSRPYTSNFPKVAIEPVDGYRGKPVFSEEYCVGCGACSFVCIGNAIKMIDPEEPVQDPENVIRKMEVHYDMCNFCGNCQAHCITEKGITLTKTFELSCFNRNLAMESVEKELIICELCHAIVTTRDYLKWLTRRLGTLSFGNPTLLLVNQRELIPVESGKPAEELRRPDILKVLCPKCRQTVMVKDIWG